MNKTEAQMDAFLPLTSLSFEILLALAKQDCHGYIILQRVRQRSQSNLHPGTLYRAISRLMGQGLIEELEERPAAEVDDRRRRYYRMTPLGKRVARAEASRLAAQVTAAHELRLLEKLEPGE
ncbi:MAG: PadR family transcriptional regulator [Acidobacteriota bacterium]